MKDWNKIGIKIKKNRSWIQSLYCGHPKKHPNSCVNVHSLKWYSYLNFTLEIAAMSKSMKKTSVRWNLNPSVGYLSCLHCGHLLHGGYCILLRLLMPLLWEKLSKQNKDLEDVCCREWCVWMNKLRMCSKVTTRFYAQQCELFFLITSSGTIQHCRYKILQSHLPKIIFLMYHFETKEFW